MHVKPKLVRFGDARSQPRGVERTVKLHAGEPVGFCVTYEGECFLLAGRDVRDLGGVRAFPVDERGRIHMQSVKIFSSSHVCGTIEKPMFVK